jgi:hypothetical protein
MFTAEERKELIGAKSATMIRQGVYEVGVLIGAILLPDKLGKLFPEYAVHIETIGLIFALCVWVWVIIWGAYRDWKSVERLEKGLDRDELERGIAGR